ncbi:COMM domain-containing protein 2 [Operophtera brumata]|uniref:COMM domain-containing protein 2 n=1 Tax=Operophtera brumata TaxID=104452 RepID=A0A0L7KUS3_OPEBR|nr:COMM domain-containing protein 2 [Operophtera brumata]
MIIFLSELQKEHLNLLHQYPTQVLIDFCKLSLDYLSNGINAKKYNVAAEKLNITVSDVQNLILALIYLIVEGSKHNLSESDFKSSLAIAGFSDEKQLVLARLHTAKKPELSQALYLLQQKDATYQDFSWRFEIQVASRNHMEQIKPMITMNFVIMTPKNFGQFKGDNRDNRVNKTNGACSSPIHVSSTIEDAKAASHCQNIISHVMLQCDLPNLLHLANKLDQALKESKSQHVRKVQRTL